MSSAPPLPQRKRPTLARWAFLLCALVLVPALVCAQSFRGTIRGQVRDASGALLTGAKVTAKNNANGLTRETVTGPEGSYVMAELPAGIYAVMAQATGLQPVAQNVVVNVGLDTTANFDVTSVEKHVEKVTVSEALPLVDSERDVLGEVVDRKLVTELPLNGRDFGKLVALVPGATVEPSGVAAIQSGFGQFAINGTAIAPTTTRSTVPTTTIPSSTTLPSTRSASAVLPPPCFPSMPSRSSTSSRNSPPNMAAIADLS